jgi:hypothetical protein
MYNYKKCQILTCIKYPDSTRDRQYPNKLNTTNDREDDTGRCLRGTIDTTIPEQAGRTAPPKNMTPHNRHTTPYMFSTKVTGVASRHPESAVR